MITSLLPYPRIAAPASRDSRSGRSGCFFKELPTTLFIRSSNLAFTISAYDTHCLAHADFFFFFSDSVDVGVCPRTRSHAGTACMGRALLEDYFLRRLDEAHAH